jgi:hypothetical protein
MKDNPVAYGYFILDCGRVFGVGHMDNRPVLDINAFTDTNVMDISTDNGIEPDTGIFTDLYIADDLGGILNECRWVDLWENAFVRFNQAPTPG